MDDAEKKAIRKVSEEINSELTGVFESFLGQWARESDGNSSVKLVEDVISKTRVETRFKDRHLIKIVKRQKAGDVNGAVAALDRRKAAEFLEPKVRYSGERFGAVVKQCKEAYWQADEGLMRRLTAQATTLASSTDKTLLEYAVITKQAARYNHESPYRSLARIRALAGKLQNQRKWYVHVGSELQAAKSHVRLLLPALQNRIRQSFGRVAPLAAQPLDQALAALKKRYGDDQPLINILSGQVKGRVASFPAGGNDRLYICVCSADLTARHLATGNTLFTLQLEEQKGGGANDSSACRECVGYLKSNLEKKKTGWLKEAFCEGKGHVACK